jgi:stage V sporulation protein D (sporulation-specific penicillin-binding protein)
MQYKQALRFKEIEMSATPKKRTKKLQTNHTILSRTLILMIVCGIVAFAVLAIRLYKVMIVDHDYYEEQAVEQQTRESTVTASRGTIYDRNGKVLAMSASVETVYISPYEMNLYEESAEDIAKGLSQILDVDYDSIMEKTTDTSSWYKTVKKKIDAELADQVRAFIEENGYKSIHLEPDSLRQYPYSSLACHVIGFVGDENYGLEGVESIYDEYLTGVNGRIVRLKSASGADMLFEDYENYYDAEDGDDLTLTLDVTIQHYAEKYLQQAVADVQAENGGAVLVMDVNTGELLAMASCGNYDLNNYLEVSDDVQQELDKITDEEEREDALTEAQLRQWRNKALSDTYEPGSVFKIITLSIALEEGLANEQSTYYCGGAIDVLGRTDPVNCWDTSGHGTQTLAEAAQNSCNCAFVQIGMDIGPEKFYEYIEAFGLFDDTGIDLSGEASSQWWSREVFCDEENLSQLAAASFGQTFAITPLQLITAVSAVANGGNLMKPYVVKEIRDSDGNTVLSNEPTVVRQVISQETSDTVNKILETVVSEGTGKNAQVPGYKVAGKTGTSEKVVENLSSDEKQYIVSFLGYAPADDPEVAVLVLLDTPSSETGIYISGGNMAAPVVSGILSEVLPYLGIEPDYTEEELENMDVTVPSVRTLSVSDAVDELENQGFSVSVVGEGETVTDQLPAANAVVASGTEVVLYAGESKPTSKVEVPNLYGMTYDEAQAYLSYYGLYVKSATSTAGDTSDVVSKQSVAFGTEVEYGTVIEVTLVDTSNLGRY